MKKVLVPTDFSPNSKSGIRFSIHWASQQRIELVFVHVLNILRATRWSDTYYEKYAKEEKALCSTKFKKFIADIYRQMKKEPGKHDTLIIEGISADISILDYCRKTTGIDCICVSTRGAGKFEKIFGTNTGNLITKATIPVLAVPKNYKVADINSVLYATDLRNYAAEIKKVVAFAGPLKTQIEVVHFTSPGIFSLDKKLIEAVFKKQFKYGFKLDFEKNDTRHSFIENLQKQISIRKPSVVVMFTDQKRTFFQKVFLSSKSEELSFDAKVPLLVFNKT